MNRKVFKRKIEPFWIFFVFNIETNNQMPNNKPDSDETLVEQFLSGDLTALPKLVKRWHKEFCNKAYWLTKDAEVSKDIAQECWKVIINKVEDLKDKKSFGSWALRIVYSKSLDWLRASIKERESLQSYAYHQSEAEVEIFDDEPIKKAILKAILKLPEQQRLVINLFYLEDYSLKQIADNLNISIGTAKSRLFHAREKLKKQLKKQLKNRNYEN